MSHTRTGARLTERHLRDQEGIASQTKLLILRLIALIFDPFDIETSAAKIAPLAAKLTLEQRQMAREATLQYLERHRAVEAPNLPPFDADMYSEEVETVDQLTRDIFVSIVAPAKLVSKKGLGADAIVKAVENSASGAAARKVADASRRPIAGYIESGRGPKGYIRVTDSDPCAFCAMIATNGVQIPGGREAKLFRSDAFKAKAADKAKNVAGWVGSEFAVHNHCNCTMEPVYERHGTVILPERTKELARIYAEVAAGRPDPEGHFARYWNSKTLPPDYEGDLPGVKRDYTPTQQKRFGKTKRGRDWLWEKNATPAQKLEKLIENDKRLIRNHQDEIHDRLLINGEGDKWVEELQKAVEHQKKVLKKRQKELSKLRR